MLAGDAVLKVMTVMYLRVMAVDECLAVILCFKY